MEQFLVNLVTNKNLHLLIMFQFQQVLKDGWTVVTADRKLSAQFEHTVGVGEDGCEIFTRVPGSDAFI